MRRKSKYCPQPLRGQSVDISWIFLPNWSALLSGNPVQLMPVTSLTFVYFLARRLLAGKAEKLRNSNAADSPLPAVSFSLHSSQLFGRPELLRPLAGRLIPIVLSYMGESNVHSLGFLQHAPKRSSASTKEGLPRKEKSPQSSADKV